jgi:hypothetical protein
LRLVKKLKGQPPAGAIVPSIASGCTPKVIAHDVNTIISRCTVVTLGNGNTANRPTQKRWRAFTEKLVPNHKM